MSRLTGIGNMWNIVREINVGELREQAEQPIRIALVGAEAVRHSVVHALFNQQQRFAGDYMAVEEYELPLARGANPGLQRCDLVLLAVDERTNGSDVAAAADQIDVSGAPALAVLVGTGAAAQRANLRNTPGIGLLMLPNLDPQTVAQRFAPDLLNRLPDDQRIAAARAIPALRDALAKRLINDTATSNATYAITSGIPEMVPILNLPLNAADLVVLTKNQVLLVYKLALLFGAPTDFQSQMREVLPVIGGGFFWRQIARQLVGLIPGFGILPKVAVAYAGTFATGTAATRWYRSGEVLSPDALKRVYQQALTLGRSRATELVEKDRQNGSGQRSSLLRRVLDRNKEQKANDD